MCTVRFKLEELIGIKFGWFILHKEKIKTPLFSWPKLSMLTYSPGRLLFHDDPCVAAA